MGLNGDSAVRFLLGQMTPDERSVFEKNYFDDDLLFEQLQAAEYEMMRDFLSGSLDRATARQFEAHYRQNPALWSVVEQERLLRSVLKPTFAERIAAFFALPPVQIGWAAATAALAAGVLFLGSGNGDLRRQVDRLQQALASVPKQVAPAAPAYLLLTPGVRRGAEQSGPEVPAQKGELRLRLVYAGPPGADYRVSVRSIRDRDREMASLPATQADSGAVAVTVDLGALPPASYSLVLQTKNGSGAFEDKASYVLEIAP